MAGYSDERISSRGACTGILSAEMYPVEVSDLRLGMLVEQLDKPWQESGFLFQGFCIRTKSELQQLREECEYVYVNLSSLSAEQASAFRAV